MAAKVSRRDLRAASSADFICARKLQAIPRSLVRTARVVREDIVERGRNNVILLLRSCFSIDPNRRPIEIRPCRHAFGSTLRRLISGASEAWGLRFLR